MRINSGVNNIIIFLPNWLTSYFRLPEKAYLELQTLRSNIESGLVLSEIKDQASDDQLQKQKAATKRTLTLFTDQVRYLERRYWARDIPLYGFYIKEELAEFYNQIEKVNDSLRAWHGGGHTSPTTNQIDA